MARVLTHLRVHKGLMMHEVAKHIGLNLPCEYSAIECGRTEPSVRQRKRLEILFERPWRVLMQPLDIYSLIAAPSGGGS